MLPSYTNVFKVYAFANMQDISPETERADVAGRDPGKVTYTGKDHPNEVQAEVATDIDGLYRDAMHVLQSKKPKEVKLVPAWRKKDDYHRKFRTKFVSLLPCPFSGK